MCNAYTLTHARAEIRRFAAELAAQLGLLLDDSGLPDDLPPRYGVRPRQRAPMLRLDGDRLVWTMGLWGLMTRGGKPGFAPTNARDDNLTAVWPWKAISQTQRCLVPADGFFEPEKPAGAKGTVPWSYYTMGNRQLFAMAGLWNAAADPKSGDLVDTFTVVTTDASPVIRIHDRMPAILEGDEAIGAWLRPGAVPRPELRPYPADRMTGWRVPDAARNSRIPDTPSMIEPVGEQGMLL